MLMAQDMQRAIAFYRDTIGLSLKSESPKWSELTFGDLIVALHGGGAGTHTKTGLSFRVSDLAAACEAAASGGGKVLQEPQSRPGEPILLAYLLDTEGNEFTMTQRVGS